MSQASEYAAQSAQILQNKANAIAEGKRNTGNLIGSTIATLGQVIPAQVQAVMKANAEKRKQEQIQGIFQKHAGNLEGAIAEIMPLDQELGNELLKRNTEAKKLAFEFTTAQTNAKAAQEKAQRETQAAERNLIARTLGAATDDDSWTQGLLTLRHAGIQHPYEGKPFDSKVRDSVLMSVMDPDKVYDRINPKPEAEGPLVPVPGPDGKPVYGTRAQAVGQPIPTDPAKEKTYQVTVPGPNGPITRLATEEEMRAGIREWRAPTQAGEGSKRWAKDPTTGDVRLMTDAEVMRIGATQPDTADMRNKAAARAVAGRGIQKVKELGTTIFRDVGPAQRAKALGRGAAAVFGNDPSFRTYQDARMATAGALAVEQQGSRVSDADVKALWLPMIPDAYSDTKDSYALKWELIDAMRGLDQSAPTTAAPSKPAATAPSGTPQVGSTVTFQGKQYKVKAIKNGQAELESLP